MARLRQGKAEGLSVTGAGQPVSQINDRCPATPVTGLQETESGLQAGSFFLKTHTIHKPGPVAEKHFSLCQTFL